MAEQRDDMTSGDLAANGGQLAPTQALVTDGGRLVGASALDPRVTGHAQRPCRLCGASFAPTARRQRRCATCHAVGGAAAALASLADPKYPGGLAVARALSVTRTGGATVGRALGGEVAAADRAQLARAAIACYRDGVVSAGAGPLPIVALAPAAAAASVEKHQADRVRDFLGAAFDAGRAAWARIGGQPVGAFVDPLFRPAGADATRETRDDFDEEKHPRDENGRFSAGDARLDGAVRAALAASRVVTAATPPGGRIDPESVHTLKEAVAELKDAALAHPDAARALARLRAAANTDGASPRLHAVAAEVARVRGLDHAPSQATAPTLTPAPSAAPHPDPLKGARLAGEAVLPPRPPVTPNPETPVHQALAQGKVVAERELSAGFGSGENLPGANRSALLTVAGPNGEKIDGIFKPRAGEPNIVRPDGEVVLFRDGAIPPGTHHLRERAVANLAEHLELHVEPTVIREHGTDVGSFQRWNHQARDLAPGEQLPRAAAEKARVADYVMGNCDRNLRNQKLLPDGSLLHFDHGTSLPTAEIPFFIQPTARISAHTGPLLPETRAYIGRLDHATIARSLAKDGIERPAIEGALLRLSQLQAGHVSHLEVQPGDGKAPTAMALRGLAASGQAIEGTSAGEKARVARIVEEAHGARR